MAETKTSCSKCGGHIAFPKTLAGQAIVCPHCHQPIVLPKFELSVAWLVAAVFATATFCLAGGLVWQSHINGVKSPSGGMAGNFNVADNNDNYRKIASPVPVVEDTDDIRTLKNLCQDYYNALNNRDFKAIQSVLSQSCQTAITTEDFKDVFDEGITYEFKGLEQVRFSTGVFGKCAAAKASRTAQNPRTGILDGWREFKFIKDSDGWKIFPSNEILNSIVPEYTTSGFSRKIRDSIKLLRDGDPFGSWDANDTNVLKAAFKLNGGSPPIFPWDFDFHIENNKIDGYSLILNYTVRNKSSTVWNSTLLDFDLKYGGKVVLTGNDLLTDVLPGRVIDRTTSFILSGEPNESTKYDLDVRYTSGIEKSVLLVQSLPLLFKVPKVSDLAELKVMSTQFDLATSEDFRDMLSARINYRVRNISSAPIKDLDVKCVWYSMSGEQLDQSTEYVISYGDIPLGVGQLKTGFVRCGKGYANSRVPVRVDVYLEAGERRNMVVKGLLVR